MSVHDERRAAFCWQEHAAIERVRVRFAGRQLATALATYLAITYYASTRYLDGGRTGFSAGRKELAALVGIKPATFDAVALGLIEIGLLDKRRRTDDTGREIAPVWTLVDHAQSGGSPNGNPGIAAGTPGSPPGESQTGTPKRAHVERQEVEQLPINPSDVSGRGGAGEAEDFPDAFPADLEPVARAVAAILGGVASRRPGCLAVKLGAVARAMRDHPNRDYRQVAGEVEHWVLYGNGQRADCKDVVRRYRHFLDGSPQLAPAAPSGGQGNVTPLRRREHPADRRDRELQEMAERLKEEGK